MSADQLVTHLPDILKSSHNLPKITQTTNNFVNCDCKYHILNKTIVKNLILAV
jgi:hypothetical protein